MSLGYQGCVFDRKIETKMDLITEAIYRIHSSGKEGNQIILFLLLHKNICCG